VTQSSPPPASMEMHYEWFRASVAVHMRSSLLWDVTQLDRWRWDR